MRCLAPSCFFACFFAFSSSSSSLDSLLLLLQLTGLCGSTAVTGRELNEPADAVGGREKGLEALATKELCGRDKGLRRHWNARES